MQGLETVLLMTVAVIGGLMWLFGVEDAHHKQWRNHHIHNYTITLRQRYRDIIGSELGDGTTLRVRNDILIEVDTSLPPEQVTLEEYEQYTVEGLFKLAGWSKSADYHSFYGFPTRLTGSAGMYDNTWVIEVVHFQPD